MRRRLICGAFVLTAFIAAGDERTSGAGAADHPPILQRFLAVDHSTPSDFRALRHLEARNEKLGVSAWMDVWTEVDSTGFQYRIVGEGGSGFIRSRVFEEALEAERDLWRKGAAARASITADNYEFGDCLERRQLAPVLEIDPTLAAAACIGVKPRRKDVMLVDGSIFLRADDGDLLGIRGALAKSPSFWTRRVEIIRRYSRIGGVRVPVAFESVASLRFAGTSTLRMTYEYERVNGRIVGTPQVADRPENILKSQVANR